MYIFDGPDKKLDFHCYANVKPAKPIIDSSLLNLYICKEILWSGQWNLFIFKLKDGSKYPYADLNQIYDLKPVSQDSCQHFTLFETATLRKHFNCLWEIISSWNKFLQTYL